MDGFFITDDDIIGTDSDAHKTFDLGDEWRASPGAGDFLSRSPELNFTVHSYLEKVHFSSDVRSDSEVKQEIKEEGYSPSHWFSASEGKQPWKKNITRTFEERHLTEQVVPDQVNVMDFQASDPLQPSSEEADELGFSTELCLEKVFRKNASPSGNEVNNSLKKAAVCGNSKSPMSISEVDNHKEQVNNYRQEGFQRGPVDDASTLNALCDRANFEQMAKTKLSKETSESSKPAKVCEELWSHSPQLVKQTPEHFNLDEKDGQFTQANDANSTSRTEAIKYPIQNVKEEEKSRIEGGNVMIQSSDEKHFALKIRKKFIKVLTPKTIPKCTLVTYSFNSSEKLPWFSDVFCPSGPTVEVTMGDTELPDVLKWQPEDKKDKEFYMVLSDSDSECDCVDVEQRSLSQTELFIGNDNTSGDAFLEDNVTSEELKMEIQENSDPLTSEFISKTPFSELVSMEASSNMLTLDDELESFLVSNMALVGDPSGVNSQLPDLSDNLGCILRNENPSLENPRKSVYRSGFSRPGVGLPTEDAVWTRIQRSDQPINLSQAYNGYGNLFNAAWFSSGQRVWQFSDSPKQQHLHRDNTNAMCGNFWPKNATNENYHGNVGRKHFLNDRIFQAVGNESFMHTVPNLPPHPIQTGIEDFEFSCSATKVEVVDSSLNYEF